MDCNPPGSSVHGILQAGVLEWGAIALVHGLANSRTRLSDFYFHFQRMLFVGLPWWLRPFNGEGDGTPLQYSCLENLMDGGAWKAAVHGVTKSWTRLNDFTFNFHFHALETEMATHSSVLAWRIPGTGEPGGLPSMGSHRVGHD